jgi:hypothetical protein
MFEKCLSRQTEAKKRLRREDRRAFDTFVLLITCTLWKQRNVIAFDNVWEQKNPGQMPKEIREEFHIWERTKRGGRLGPVQE